MRPLNLSVIHRHINLVIYSPMHVSDLGEFTDRTHKLQPAHLLYHRHARLAPGTHHLLYNRHARFAPGTVREQYDGGCSYRRSQRH